MQHKSLLWCTEPHLRFQLPHSALVCSCTRVVLKSATNPYANLDLRLEATVLLYAIVFIGGSVAGFLLPASRRSFWVLLITGLCFLAIVSALAAISSYDGTTIRKLLSLTDSSGIDKLGLIQLAAAAYACIVAGVVAGIRSGTTSPRGD